MRSLLAVSTIIYESSWFFPLLLHYVRFFFLPSALFIIEMSSEGESHLVSNISKLQGFGKSSPWKIASPNFEEVRAASLDSGEVGTSF